MSAMFSSLSVRNYRIYATGAIVSNTGTWMGRVAQDWVVLMELTDRSATALGIVTGLQFLPMLLLAPIGGAISDRFAKRRVMLITQTVMALTAVAMAVMVLTGVMQLWHMFVLAFLQGCAAAIDAPARQSFVSEMVPPSNLANAVGLNSASFHLGRLIGPAIAGVLIATLGSGVTLAVNSATFLAVMVALVMMNAGELTPSPRARGKGKIREGIAYVRHRPDILLIMAVVFVHGTFGMNFQLFNILMATNVFEVGAREFGLLGSVMAIGSLAGALWAARRERPRLRHLLVAMGAFSLCGAGLALAPTFEIYAILLVPAGLTALTVMVTANSMVQLSVDPQVRGRVMALYMAVFMGGTPIGAPLLGRLAELIGERATMLASTSMCGLAVLAATMYVMHTDNIHIRLHRGDGRWLTLTRGPVEPVPDRAT